MSEDNTSMLEIGGETMSLTDIGSLNVGSFDEWEGFPKTPTGLYHFKCKEAGLKVLGNAPNQSAGVQVVCTIVDIKAIEKGENAEDWLGKDHTETFFLKDEDGIGRLIKLARMSGLLTAEQLKEDRELSDLCAMFIDHEFYAKVKRGPSKKDPDIIYSNINLLDKDGVAPLAAAA